MVRSRARDWPSSLSFRDRDTMMFITYFVVDLLFAMATDDPYCGRDKKEETTFQNYVLQGHNRFRSIRVRNPLNKLTYSCDLEKKAEAAVENCPKNPPNGNDIVAFEHFANQGSLTHRNVMAHRILRLWTRQVTPQVKTVNFVKKIFERN
ncbi:hypothetical protein KIN20_010112 [Parelaphostrongylus tenuis]|uniref:SCP domain-containing protein n=1 Tax=Parelaphostrongylus tenuis TaxID=148309 RepID=A0AAD5MYL5_PARTN|nr:hypothetical protein KIN20_010112 [Parelaphostrongylus tenuis]